MPRNLLAEVFGFTPDDFSDDATHPWLRFAGMWADDLTWDEFLKEIATYRQEIDAPEADA